MSWRIRHAQLVEQEAEDVGAFFDLLVEGGAEAVSGTRGCTQENGTA